MPIPLQAKTDGSNRSMKTMTVLLIVVVMSSLLTMSSTLLSSAEVPGESGYESKECYTGDHLGYWFDNLKWFGFAFDDWSYGSNAEESSRIIPPERVLLLLRHSKGHLQPYLSIDPGLIISEKGFELDLSTPTVFLGLSCTF